MNHSITNDLKAKLDDLRFMEDELEATKVDLRQRDEMVRDLSKDNERLQLQLERAMEKADKLQAYAVNLTTRLQVISDNVDSIIREASRSAIAEAGRLKERRQDQGRIEAQPAAPARQASRDVADSVISQALRVADRLPQGRYVSDDHQPPEPEPQSPEDYAPRNMVNRLPADGRTRPPANEWMGR